jgi:hypothetical protein
VKKIRFGKFPPVIRLLERALVIQRQALHRISVQNLLFQVFQHMLAMFRQVFVQDH